MDNPAEERGLILDNVYERLTASRSAARAGGLVEAVDKLLLVQMLSL